LGGAIDLSAVTPPTPILDLILGEGRLLNFADALEEKRKGKEDARRDTLGGR
jgi:hypothetical protein